MKTAQEAMATIEKRILINFSALQRVVLKKYKVTVC